MRKTVGLIGNVLRYPLGLPGYPSIDLVVVRDWDAAAITLPDVSRVLVTPALLRQMADDIEDARSEMFKG